MTKTDLINEQKITEITDSIKQRIKDSVVFAISNETQDGYEALKMTIEKGKTYFLLTIRE